MCNFLNYKISSYLDVLYMISVNIECFIYLHLRSKELMMYFNMRKSDAVKYTSYHLQAFILKCLCNAEKQWRAGYYFSGGVSEVSTNMRPIM